MAALRAKSLALTDLFIALVERAAPAIRWNWSRRASMRAAAARSASRIRMATP